MMHTIENSISFDQMENSKTGKAAEGDFYYWYRKKCKYRCGE
jgi:hypothetical protein